LFSDKLLCVLPTGHDMLPTTECDQDEQYDNHIESQLDNGKATKVRETPI